MEFRAIILCIHIGIKYIIINHQLPISNYNQSPTHHQPINLHSASPYQPLSYPLLSHHPPLNKTTIINYFEISFLSVDLTVVCWCSNVYLYIIDCTLHKMMISTFKLTRPSLETVISMAKQLHYECCEICNVIILDFVELQLIWISIAITCHIGFISNTIGYIYIIWIIMDAIHINYIHKSYINGSDGCELNKNGSIQYTLNGSITTMIKIEKYDTFDTNISKMNQFCQIDDVMHNLNLIITIIKVIDTIAYQIEILIAICVIICKTFTCIEDKFVLVAIDPNTF